MKCKLALTALSLLLGCMIPQASAYDIEPFSTSMELNTYIETRIIVSFAFTQNVTSDAYSAGKSVWQVNIDPLSTSFTTSAADKFTWKLRISYGVVVDQTVTIAVFSGDEAIDTTMFNVQTDQLVLNFEITITKQPEYPTAEDLAAKSVEVLQNELHDYTMAMTRLNEVMRQNMITQWVIVIAVLCVAGLQLWKEFVKGPKREEHP